LFLPIDVDQLIISGSHDDRKFMLYNYALTPAWPNITIAPAILTFALNEARKLQIPRHLPPTRAIADATQRLGPTAEDYFALTKYRTRLAADTSPSRSDDCLSCLDPLRSISNDQDFIRMAPILDANRGVFGSNIPAYIPGTLSGLWEGTWMVKSKMLPLSAYHDLCLLSSSKLQVADRTMDRPQLLPCPNSYVDSRCNAI
jgi:hypothetical protein